MALPIASGQPADPYQRGAVVMALSLREDHEQEKAFRAVTIPELLIPCIVLAVGGFLVYYSQSHYVYMNPASGPGPAFFPTWLGVTLMALASVLIASDLLLRRSKRTSPEGEVDESSNSIFRPRTVLLFASLTALAIWLMGLVGTVPALAVFVCAESLLVEKRSLARAVYAAMFIPLAVLLIFVVGLRVPLPGPLSEFIRF